MHVDGLFFLFLLPFLFNLSPWEAGRSERRDALQALWTLFSFKLGFTKYTRAPKNERNKIIPPCFPYDIT